MKEVAESVIKNNMGLGGIQLRVRGALADGVVTVVETGQKLPVEGGPARSTQPWLWLEAREYGLGHTDALAWQQETAQPTLGP